MRIAIDEQSGFCFGVVGAIARAEESLTGGGEVFCLGDIVHNRLEVTRLESMGLRCIRHDALGDLRQATLLIRAHGEPPATYALARRNGLRIIDATCPVVARLQKIVVQARQAMKPLDGQVVILGKRGHAEVVGLTGQVDEQAIVIEGIDDLDIIDFTRPIYLLSQTTQSLRLFGQVSDAILARAADPAQVTLHDTICRQVSNREAHIADFARQFDLILFVAGRKSSNGRVLFDVCRSANPTSHWVESPADIQREWLQGIGSVGICGATSTPKWLMEQVAAAIGAA